MGKETENLKTSIVLPAGEELKPTEITLDYLVNGIEVVEPIVDHDYDINIFSLKYNSLNFLKEEDSLKELLRREKVYTVDRIYRLKLLDLSRAGVGLVPASLDDSGEELSRYGYLSQFIECINDAIMDEREKEARYAEFWNDHHQYNLNKFRKAQCKNKVGFWKLFALRAKIRSLLKQIEFAKKVNKKSVYTYLASKAYYFCKYKLFLFRYCRISRQEYNALFTKLGMPRYNGQSKTLLGLQHKIDCYKYVLEAYNHFLTCDLQLFKQKNIKKITDSFLVDSFELKKTVMDCIDDDSKYNELNEYDLDFLYDLYRESLCININDIVSTDIRQRKFIDTIIQVVPIIVAVASGCFAFELSFDYNFTLLKDMWKRYLLMGIFVVITLCAIVTMVNLFRNAKQFKRPKRKLMSQLALAGYFIFAICFSVLNNYFITRYDGYDDTYYYVHVDKNIKIDGLRNTNKTSYFVPRRIDGHQVVSITDNVFSGNENVKTIEFSSVSKMTLGNSCFKGCTNLKNVYLPASVTEVPDSTFENCNNLQNVDFAGEITKIGASAFKNCSKYKKIDISHIKNIGKDAFSGCEKLGEISFNEELEVISSRQN